MSSEAVAVAGAVAALDPIALDGLERHAALLRRVERKYLLGSDLAAALVERLAPSHRALEIDGRRRFAYRSTYFDSDDLRVFRDHVAGRRRLQVPDTPVRRQRAVHGGGQAARRGAGNVKAPSRDPGR